jgi:hypothetical protein
MRKYQRFIELGGKNVGFEVLTAVVMKSTIFWDIKPCSPLKVNRRFWRTYRLHFQGQRIGLARNQLYFPPDFTLVSCSAYSSTLKMEAICSSEATVDFQRRYIPEDSTLHGNIVCHSAHFLGIPSDLYSETCKVAHFCKLAECHNGTHFLRKQQNRVNFHITSSL